MTLEFYLDNVYGNSGKHPINILGFKYFDKTYFNAGKYDTEYDFLTSEQIFIPYSTSSYKAEYKKHLEDIIYSEVKAMLWAFNTMYIFIEE